MGKIIVGSAKLDENGHITGGKPGDQKGGQEVAMQDFYSHSKGWYILRPKDVSLADKMGNLMRDACENNNLGYNQAQRDQVIKNGIHTNIPTNCDCSSLVRACVKEASGRDPGAFNTESESSALERTGLFLNRITFSDLTQTPVYQGDVLVTRSKGHTVIVVSSCFIRTGSTGLVDSLGELNEQDQVPASTPTQYTSYSGFTPRTTPPVLAPPPDPIYGIDSVTQRPVVIGYTEDVRDLWYVGTNDGGRNIFNTLDRNSYIWCRFSEVAGASCNLGRGTLASLYFHKEDNYKREMAPSLGAVMCFTQPGTSGWAGIVEGIDPDGSVVLSYYTPSGSLKLSTISKYRGYWDFDGYKFVGFIHNPGVNMLGVSQSAKETFIRIAEGQIGTDESWTISTVDITSNNGWSAAFVTACAAVAGNAINIILPNVVSCSAIGRVGVLRNMGEWLPGPAQGGFTNPQPGDIVLFRKVHNTKGMSTYDADGAGIVTQTLGNFFNCVEGDNGGKVTKEQYNVSSKMISGYFRPKWDIIDGTSDSVNQFRNIEGLYTEGTTREDAAVREVCFLDSNFKPSIQSSKLKLSVVNYTGLLGNMYSVFASTMESGAAKAELIADLWTNTVKSYYQTDGIEYESTAQGLMEMFDNNIRATSTEQTQQSTTVDASNIPAIKVDVSANMRTAFDFLTSNGFTSAAACGVLGNIKAESNFNTAAQGDKSKTTGKYTSFGICQWHNNRGTNMKNFVGENWYNDLTGQLRFLLHELQTSYKSVWSAIASSPNSIAGAKHVADVFVRQFERPAHVDDESIKRQGYAAGVWNELVN